MTAAPACIRRAMSTWPTCPCPDCARLRNRTRGLRELHPDTWRTPPEAAWAALARYVDAGWTCSAIATATGLRVGYVSNLMGDYRAGRIRRIGPYAARALTTSAMEPTIGLLPVVGTRRRLRALTRAGWAGAHVAAQAGVSPSTLSPLLLDNRDRVSVVVEQAVRGVYGRLGDRLGGNVRALSRAHRLGWPAPWDWAGLDMDDPGVVPDGFRAKSA